MTSPICAIKIAARQHLSLLRRKILGEIKWLDIRRRSRCIWKSISRKEGDWRNSIIMKNTNKNIFTQFFQKSHENIALRKKILTSRILDEFSLTFDHFGFGFFSG